jgi:type IV pilus assembly protein PilQ
METVKGTSSGEATAVITEIRLQDNSVTIMSDKYFVYTMYKGSDPYKVTIDIPDMGAGRFNEKIISDKAGITEITLQPMDSPVKSLKINVVLQNPSVVASLYKDNMLTLTVNPEEPAPAALTESKGPVGSSPSESKPAAESVSSGGVEVKEVEPVKPPEDVIANIPHATEINSIEVSRAEDALKIVISGNGSMMPNVFPIDKRIVIDIPGVVMKASIPSAVVKPLKGIRAGKHKDKVRLVLDLREKTKFEVTAIGKSIEVTLKSGTAEDGAVAQADPRVKKSRKEARVKEARVKEALKEAPAIEPAKEAPHDAPASEPVKEAVKEPAAQINAKDLPADTKAKSDSRFDGKKISLDFQDADIGPIFRLLADVNGYNLVLDPSIKGKVTIKLMNVPWDQSLSIILNTFNLGKSIEGNILWIAPQSVFSKIAEERSAAKMTEEKTEDLTQEIVRVNYATSGDISSAISAAKLLSPRGNITQDLRMNTLIIKDTQKSIQRIKELVKIMDVTKPQVMIEAKIVEVSTSHSEALGIRWGGAMSLQTGPYPISGTFAVNTPVTVPASGGSNPGGVIGMTVGAANRLKVDLSLSALESITKARTLSAPKILTMDNESATIQQGSTFYIPTVSQSGTTSTAVTATLSLNVTPKITPDGYVQLKVTATDNSLQPGTAGAAAVVNTKSLTTQALVKNGETLVLGGIYRRDEATSEDGVPILSRIPGLGWLFKTRTTSGPDIKELMIFITPTVITQQTENK